LDFKKDLGCAHAIFALRQCVEYFVSRDSSVFMAALDSKKALIDEIYPTSKCILYFLLEKQNTFTSTCISNTKYKIQICILNID